LLARLGKERRGNERKDKRKERKGKGRKGKGRKGKGRKGKEREGKGRKGKEREGKGRKENERKGNETKRKIEWKYECMLYAQLCSAQLSNAFAGLENLNDSDDVNWAREDVKENVRTPTKDILGLYEL